jgi:hypothetical protein
VTWKDAAVGVSLAQSHDRWRLADPCGSDRGCDLAPRAGSHPPSRSRNSLRCRARPFAIHSKSSQDDVFPALKRHEQGYICRLNVGDRPQWVAV